MNGSILSDSLFPLRTVTNIQTVSFPLQNILGTSKQLKVYNVVFLFYLLIYKQCNKFLLDEDKMDIFSFIQSLLKKRADYINCTDICLCDYSCEQSEKRNMKRLRMEQLARVIGFHEVGKKFCRFDLNLNSL